MDLLSETSLTIIAQSLHATKKQWKTVVDSPDSIDTEVADAEDYLMQLDQVFGVVRREYEKLREKDKPFIPFGELFNIKLT